MAISEVTGHPLHLESFAVQSVSEGEDAMAEASVRVSTEFETYQGRGTSTDTVLAGARAYLDVINRIERRTVRQKSIAIFFWSAEQYFTGNWHLRFSTPYNK